MSMMKRYSVSFILVSFLLVNTACSTAKLEAGSDGAFPSVQAYNIFRESLDTIDLYYHEDLGPDVLRDLSLGAIENLLKPEDGFSLEHKRQGIVLATSSEKRSLAMPQENSSAKWAQLLVESVLFARERSFEMREKSTEEIYDLVISGMLSKLDRYSRYLTAEESKETGVSRNGYTGIGVSMRQHDEGILISAVYENGPAAKAGLKPDDVVIRVQGKKITKLTDNKIAEVLRSPEGSKIHLAVKRNGSVYPLLFEVICDFVIPQTVFYEAKGNIAHIKITGFNQDTSNSFREKVFQAKRELKGRLSGFVLDLRDNPGGNFNEAIKVADAFLHSGIVIKTIGQHSKSNKVFYADREDLSASLPVIVLINENSASAAEVLAGSLRDNGRAILIGSKSYGKGSVQRVIKLPNGGEMDLTWAKYAIPSDYILHGKGLMPDMCTIESQAALYESVKRQSARTLNISSNALLQAQNPANLAASRQSHSNGSQTASLSKADSASSHTATGMDCSGKEDPDFTSLTTTQVMTQRVLKGSYNAGTSLVTMDQIGSRAKASQQNAQE